MFWDVDQFSMRSIARYPLPDLEVCYARTEFDDRARVTVSQRHGLIEPCKDCFQCWEQSVGTDFVEHLLDSIWLLTRFGNQTCPAELDQHAFGAGRDETGTGSNQNMAVRYLRTGDAGQVQYAGS